MRSRASAHAPWIPDSTRRWCCVLGVHGRPPVRLGLRRPVCAPVGVSDGLRDLEHPSAACAAAQRQQAWPWHFQVRGFDSGPGLSQTELI
eukprot:1979931-Rhodomonas_salina.3